MDQGKLTIKVKMTITHDGCEDKISSYKVAKLYKSLHPCLKPGDLSLETNNKSIHKNDLKHPHVLSSSFDLCDSTKKHNSR
jgi:hypothetical protein